MPWSGAVKGCDTREERVHRIGPYCALNRTMEPIRKRNIARVKKAFPSRRRRHKSMISRVGNEGEHPVDWGLDLDRSLDYWQGDGIDADTP